MPVITGYIGNRFRLVAQLDRASGFEPEGWGFESLRAGHFRAFPDTFSPVERAASPAVTRHRRIWTQPTSPIRVIAGTAGMGVAVVHRSNEMRIDPVVWATVLFGVLIAVVLVAAI